MGETRFPGWVFVAYAVLFVLAIPWYLPKDFGASIWGGVPLWVGLSFLVTIAIAVFTVFVIRRYWHDDDSETGG